MVVVVAPVAEKVEQTLKKSMAVLADWTGREKRRIAGKRSRFGYGLCFLTAWNRKLGENGLAQEST